MSTTYRSARPATDPIRHPEGSSPGVRSRRALWLVLMTLVVPGSAQVVAGNRRLGRLGLRVLVGVLAVVAALLVLSWLDRSLLIGVLTRTPVLLLVTVVLVALAVLWGVLFADAWRLAGTSRLPDTARKVVSGLTAALVLVTSGSLLYTGYLTSTSRNLIAAVFGGGAAADAVDGRYNVLLIGGDAGADRVGLRNDTNILVSIDADTGAAVQIGIPRNLSHAPLPADSPLASAFPDGFDADEAYFNGIYTYGSEHPEAFPGAANPGAEAVKDAVEGVTGLEVQYYALVNLQGFEQLVDAIGGVEVDVRKRVPKAAVTDRRAKEFIEPGRQRLDGADALWFARSRFESSDYERMARQRCVMSAMLAQLDPQTVLLRFQDIAAASPDAMSTDIPQAHLGDFVDLAIKAKGQPVTSVQLVPPVVDTGDPDFELTRRLVREAVATSEGGPQDAPEAGQDGGQDGGTGQDAEPDGGRAASQGDEQDSEQGGGQDDAGRQDRGDRSDGQQAPVAQDPQSICSA